MNSQHWISLIQMMPIGKSNFCRIGNSLWVTSSYSSGLALSLLLYEYYSAKPFKLSLFLSAYNVDIDTTYFKFIFWENMRFETEDQLQHEKISRRVRIKINSKANSNKYNRPLSLKSIAIGCKDVPKLGSTHFWSSPQIKRLVTKHFTSFYTFLRGRLGWSWLR